MRLPRINPPSALSHVSASVLWLCSILLLGAATNLHAQQPKPQPATPPASSAIPTLRAQANLVVLDVVVTDRNHHPVPNLKQSDFSILERNQPQVINSFAEHRALTAAEAKKFPPIPPMPPGVFTNFVPTPVNSAVNILLLDALNTPMRDQAYVRQQLLAYLKNARPGTNIAIFGLSTRLVMLQGFTADPETLKSVVTKLLARSSPLLDDTVGGGGTTDTASDLNDSMGGGMSADAVAGMQTFMDMQQSFQLTLRAKYTLDAMNLLAHYLSAIPGRKNLIWFSGSFPLNIMPDIDNNPSNPFAAMADSEAEYRETTNLLTRSQVAVYPVDARGLMVSPVFSAAADGAKYARNPGAFSRDERAFSNSQADEHSTMQRMADDTGGHAFYNTNGLTAAVDKAIESGSSYYTLTYSPINTTWKGDFRKIQVKLAQSGLSLEYRRGYYADDPASPNTALVSPAAALRSSNAAAPTASSDPGFVLRAMAHGVPGSTEILYKVRVAPVSSADETTLAAGNVLATGKATPKPPFRRYTVDFAALAGDLTYTSTPDGLRHTELEFLTLLYAPDGTLANRVTDNVKVTLTSAQLQAVLKSGLPFHQQISVPYRGDWSIRTGVHDLHSNRMGATEFNVSAVKNLPPLQPAPPPQPSTAPAKP